MNPQPNPEPEKPKQEKPKAFVDLSTKPFSSKRDYWWKHYPKRSYGKKKN